MKVISKEFSNMNKGMALDNGDWKVEVMFLEVFTYDDGSEKREIIETACYDRNFQTAHQVALSSALAQYREEVYDKGMISLIEAREKYGRPNDNSGNNTDTLTQ
jgi:hypothetical protein